MGYSISLNLIHQPETDDVDERPQRPHRRARSTGSSGRSRRSATTAPGRTSAARTCPVPVILVGSMAGTDVAAVDRDRQPGDRAAGDRAPARRRRAADRRSSPGRSDWWEAQERLRRLARDPRRPRDRGRRTALVVEGDWGADERRARRSSACSSELPDVDAIFASNDQMALGVLHGAHRLGPPGPRGPLGRRRRRHPRGVPLLAVADDRPSAAPGCRRAGGPGDRPPDPTGPPAPGPGRPGAPGDPAPAQARRPQQQPPGIRGPRHGLRDRTVGARRGATTIRRVDQGKRLNQRAASPAPPRTSRSPAAANHWVTSCSSVV